MRFTSKTEAYTYIWAWLDLKIKQKKEDDDSSAVPTLEICLSYLRKALLNHEQYPETLSVFLDIAKNTLPEDEDEIQTLKDALEDSDYMIATDQERFENPLGRRFESELALSLLLNPTKKMMEAVRPVSEAIALVILRTIENIKDEDVERHEFITKILNSFTTKAHQIACGAFPEPPTVQDVLQVLIENKPEQLPAILLMHFRFANAISRKIPIIPPDRKPCINIIRAIEPIASDPTVFFKGLAGRDNKYRCYFANELFYQTLLYRAEPSRGRFGELQMLSRTNEFGLMLRNQKEYAKGLPKLSGKGWVPDCKFQAADLESLSVRDHIYNDAIYVSGYSAGMMGLMMGQMIMMLNPETIEEQQHYLSALFAYIVGGGFHSIHETLGAAHYGLELIPGYQVTAPDKHMPAEPPQFEIFFHQQCAIDPEFKSRLDTAHSNYLSFFRETYMPLHEDRLFPLVWNDEKEDDAELRARIQQLTFSMFAHPNNNNNSETNAQENTPVRKASI